MGISDLFRGSALNAVDGKGRVTLPADYRATVRCRYRRAVHETGYDPAPSDPDDRRRAGRAATLVKDPDRPCLVGYEDVYAGVHLDRIERRHADKSGLERERAIHRDQGYFGASEDAAWDGAGRIMLTPRMRARAGIADAVYFFARGETFELWNPATFDSAHRDEAPDWAEDCRLAWQERGALPAPLPQDPSG